MSTNVQIQLIEGALAPVKPTAEKFTRVGAVLQFEGVVREQEEGRQLLALHYEAYEPMTRNELEKLARRILQQHGLIRIIVEHSLGRVAVGEISFRLTLISAHRAEGLAACGQFIDEMKRYVPLWKNLEFSEPTE